MSINKGLIIADPWIGFLLNGSKIWEMRSSGANHRGWFGLIRKGTGAVYGVARLVDVGPPLSPTEMIATIDHHRIPEAMIRSGEVAKWNTPWKLADVRRLPRPVPYVHKSGAVTWVELDAEAVEGIIAQAPEVRGGISMPSSSGRSKARAAGQAAGTDDVRVDVSQRGRKLIIDITWDDGRPDPAFAATRTSAAPPTKVSAPSLRSVPASTTYSSARMIGEVELTEGNIANNHFYLRTLVDRLPADVIGGSNRTSTAPRQISIDWGGPDEVLTDIDGQKKIFRARGWIGNFYKTNRAAAGDKVVVELTSPYCIRVSLRKSDRKYA